jgi:hypothetical protein
LELDPNKTEYPGFLFPLPHQGRDYHRSIENGMPQYMNIIAKTTYRVHVDGLSPKERTIFGGMIPLAERRGTHFQVEAALENSDIFIFDGSDQRAVEYGQSHSQIAQRTIWIDPPSHLQSSRHIKRPLRWSHLLEMMEQIGAESREPSVAVQRQPILETPFDQLCALSASILRTHIGIAAEFVIEDTRAEMKPLADANQQISTDVFLNILKQHLPTNVDAGKIIREISAAVAQVRPT